MSQWSWKQAVADEVLKLVNSQKSLLFTLSDVYAFDSILQKKFPRNQNVRPKIRQILQKLRDDGLVLFLGDGRYTIDSDYMDIELEPEVAPETKHETPPMRTVLREVRLRNTLLAGYMKRRYKNRCQVCRETIQLSDRTYSEAHHIRPLGAPHLGKDAEGNILVLCPNHHVMFDRGAVSLDRRSLLVSHPLDAFPTRKLWVAPWHKIHMSSVDYYMSHMLGPTQGSKSHENRN